MLAQRILSDAGFDAADVAARLRSAGARFGFALRRRRPSGVEVCVAVWFGRSVDARAVAAVVPELALVVLDDAALDDAGPVAAGAPLLFDDDVLARVAWQATTRRLWLGRGGP